jgi:hypothetical protein
LPQHRERSPQKRLIIAESCRNDGAGLSPLSGTASDRKKKWLMKANGTIGVIFRPILFQSRWKIPRLKIGSRKRNSDSLMRSMHANELLRAQGRVEEAKAWSDRIVKEPITEKLLTALKSSACELH